MKRTTFYKFHDKKKERRTDIIILLLWFALSVYVILDAFQSKALFDMGAQEANPIVGWIMIVTGTWVSLVIVKGLLVFALGILLVEYVIRRIEEE